MKRIEWAIIWLIVWVIITALSYVVYSLSLYLYNHWVNEFVIAWTIICGIWVFVWFCCMWEEK